MHLMLLAMQLQIANRATLYHSDNFVSTHCAQLDLAHVSQTKR